MSQLITEAMVRQYSANVHMLASQEGSKLRMCVRNESQIGKSAFYDRLSSTTAVKKVSRHSDTPQIDSAHSRRRVTMSDYHWADLIDNDDKIRTLIDPASMYAKKAAEALGRAMDLEIIAGALGTAYTGEDGTGTQAIGNGNRIAAVASSSISNLNLLALRTAKKIMDAADVPASDRYLVVNASGLFALLGDTTITSADFNTVKALVQGEINTFMGFQFIMTNLVATQLSAFSYNTATGLYDGGGSSATTGISLFAFQRDGLLLSTGQEIKGRISERDDKNYSVQVYAEMSAGAVRMEEARVVEIICAQ